MAYSAMELAEVFIKTGELRDALDALDNQLGVHPHDDEARRLRIQVQMRLSDGRYLQQALADASALSTHTVDDYLSISIIYQRLGNTEQALASMRQALEILPSDARLTERLLQLLIADNSLDAALKLVRQQDPTWRWLQWEGDVLVLMGDDMTATARYGLVLANLAELQGKIQSEHLGVMKARVLLARAHAYRRLGHVELAREHYSAAQQIIPDDASIAFNLGLLYYLDGNQQLALEECRQALSQAPQALRNEMLETLKQDTAYHELYEQLSR